MSNDFRRIEQRILRMDYLLITPTTVARLVEVLDEIREEADTSDRWITVEVRDSGIGFTFDRLERPSDG